MVPLLFGGRGAAEGGKKEKKKSFSFTPPEYKMDQIPVLWYYISSMLLSATHYSLTETVNFIEGTELDSVSQRLGHRNNLLSNSKQL